MWRLCQTGPTASRSTTLTGLVCSEVTPAGYTTAAELVRALLGQFRTRPCGRIVLRVPTRSVIKRLTSSCVSTILNTVRIRLRSIEDGACELQQFT